MVELFTIIRYLKYDTLKSLDLKRFDNWTGNWGESKADMEISPYEEEYLSKTSRLFELNIELSNSDENFEKTDGNEVDNGENVDELENEDIDNDVETDIEETKIKRSDNSER